VPERATVLSRSEKSAEAVVAASMGAKGQRNRRKCPLLLGNGLSQMFARAKLVDTVTRVKPEALRQRETKSGGPETSIFRRCAGIHSCNLTSTISTARCGPACRVVWEGSVR